MGRTFTDNVTAEDDDDQAVPPGRQRKITSRRHGRLLRVRRVLAFRLADQEPAKAQMFMVAIRSRSF